ncbi:PQQ-dependent sugar dehydrogenase [Jiangella rhizosphaerae]|uniref:PKD domain-containing protein n=1 Tax=Jiangella rhizosphaerae TaxID=2293569 RepID=A0A418KQ82_9ACTN|nr:PQQ-dependent sugar dehydrogenase [Jiangella rhizosphaerae]RIQ22257.1 PKD domain-containing protein [Jiangella rhizosphaerae]
MRRIRRTLTTLVAAALLPVAALTATAPATAHDNHEPGAEDPALNWDNYEKILLSKNTGEPIDLAVLPDSRVLHTARNGDVRLTDPSTGITRVVNTIDVYQNSEDGLQTIALDPDFQTNQWVYLYYAPRVMEAPYPQTTPAGSAPNSLPAGETESYWDRWKGYNVLARFKWDEETDSLDLSTKQEIIKVETQRGQCCHVAGDMAWDADGNLYLSTGDNTPASTPGANGMAPNNDAPGMNPGFDARRGPGNTNDLRGKILRITVQEDGSYTVPEGNLFAPGTAGTRPEIYVMGVRNPFRIDYDIETGALVWGDYGPDAGAPNPDRGPMGYVEWQTTRTPINGGWPYCHGPNANYNEWNYATATPGEWFDCEAGAENNSRWNTGLDVVPPATAPHLYYGDNASHQPWPELTDLGGGGQGPMGGPVYRHDPDNPSPAKFPEFWDGHPFFAEFSQDYVAVFTLDLATSGPVTDIIDFLPNAHLNHVAQPIWDNVMDMEFGPDGSLYVLEYGDGFFRQNPDAGLYRVDYAEGNKSPQARFTADPISSSSAPLTVTFDASDSADPEGAALTYEWDFDGNGTFDASGVTVTHTYTELGQYNASLRVTDPSGKFGVRSTQITVGNVAPTVTLDTPTGGFFDWGQAVPVSVSVSDPEDGNTPVCSRVSWAFGLGHDEHAHPLTSGTGCTFGVPTPADAPEHGVTENIYGGLVVGYTDNGHLGVPPARGEASLLLNPKTQQAEWFDASNGVQVTDDPDARGLRKVTSFDAGDWIAFDPVNLVNIDSVVARAWGRGTLHLRWNDPKAAPFATISFRNRTGWFEVEQALTNAPQGSGRLYLTSTSGFELDELRFVGNGVADVTPPTVSHTLNPAAPTGQNGWYTGDVTLTVNATDNGTVASRQRSLDGGVTWANANNPLTITAEGSTTVHYRATDNGGNVSSVGSVTVKIDKTPPAASIGGVENGGSYAASGTLTPSFAGTDAVSGIASVTGTLDGAPLESGSTVQLWTLTVGQHALGATATDNAGRQGTAATTFTVTTSLADLAAIVDHYAGAGALTAAGESRLRLHLDTAVRNAEAGRPDSAVRSLGQFASTARSATFVTDAAARTVLTHHAEVLTAQLSA